MTSSGPSHEEIVRALKEASLLRDRAITERNLAREDLKTTRKDLETLQDTLTQSQQHTTQLQHTLTETQTKLHSQTETLSKLRVAHSALALELTRAKEVARESQMRAERSERERELVVRERSRMEAAEDRVRELRREVDAERAAKLRAMEERHAALERLAALEGVKRDLDELHVKHGIECARVNALTRTLAAAGVAGPEPPAAVPEVSRPVNLVEEEASKLVQAPQGSPLSHLQRPSDGDDDDPTSEAALARLKKMGKHWKRNSSFSPANTQVEKVRESPRKPSKSDQDQPTGTNGERRAFR